jgi:hypothetical protein
MSEDEFLLNSAAVLWAREDFTAKVGRGLQTHLAGGTVRRRGAIGNREQEP